MNWKLIAAITFSMTALSLSTAAPHKEKTDKHDEGHDHAEEHDPHGPEAHGHSDEHGDHAEGHEETSSNVGPGKAVTEANSKQGIKLSEKARQSLNILTAPLKGSGPSSVPPQAIVRSRDEIGVYRLRDGWFKLVRLAQLKVGDEIVIHGAPLLRIAELDAFSAGESGHAH